MKTTFKKTLLAAAVAGFSVNAFAVDLGASTANDAVAVTVSTERLSSSATTFNVPATALNVTLGAEYAVGDLLTFTFSNDAIASTQFKTTVTSTTDVAVVPSGASAVVTLGLLSSTATSVTYRVTEVANATSTIGQQFTIAAGANMVASAAKLLANNGLTVTYSATTSSGTVIDNGNVSITTAAPATYTLTNTPSFQLVHVGSEFSVSVPTKLNAVIDVEDSRLLFSDVGAHSTTVDVLGATTAQASGIDTDGASGPLGSTAFTTPVTFTNVKHTITGDFSWVEDDDSTTAGIQPVASTLALAGCTGAADADDATWTATSVSFTCTNAGAATAAFSVVQGGTEAPIALPTTSFTLDSVISYNDGAAKTTARGPLEAGSWTLNGSQVRVPYMVVNNSRFGIIANVTNHGSKDGSITLDVFAEDGEKLATNYAAGTSKAGSVTSVAGALKAALVAAGKDLDNTTKFSFQVTTNVPENDVQVYAAYTDSTTSERAIVNNDGKVQNK